MFTPEGNINRVQTAATRWMDSKEASTSETMGGDMVTAILRFHLDSVWNELPSRSEGHTCDLDLEASDSDIEANRHRHLIKVFRQEDTHLCSKS